MGDNFLDLTFDYRTLTGVWSMMVEQSGVVLVESTILQPNTNAIQNYPDLRSYGKLWFVGDEATLDNLGTNNNLVWEEPA